MIRLVSILSLFTGALSAVIYIDRFSLDSNGKVSNFSTSFTHNEKRNAVVNLTIQFSKPLTKLLVYVKVNLAENEHDREYKRQFLRTFFDVEKTFKGAQQNFIMAAFVENLKKFKDFEVRFPLEPVSVFVIQKHSSKLQTLHLFL